MNKKKVVKHLKSDARTWDKLSTMAKREAKHDRKLAQQLKPFKLRRK